MSEPTEWKDRADMWFNKCQELEDDVAALRRKLALVEGWHKSVVKGCYMRDEIAEEEARRADAAEAARDAALARAEEALRDGMSVATELAAAREEVERLTDALRPFAKYAHVSDMKAPCAQDVPDDAIVHQERAGMFTATIRVGDYRRARAVSALAPREDGTGEEAHPDE